MGEALPPLPSGGMNDYCSCSRIKIGMTVTEQRNWNPDCHEHGTMSKWYHSDEQVAKRQAQRERLLDLQTQAREARRRARDGQ